VVERGAGANKAAKGTGSEADNQREGGRVSRGRSGGDGNQVGTVWGGTGAAMVGPGDAGGVLSFNFTGAALRGGILVFGTGFGIMVDMERGISGVGGIEGDKAEGYNGGGRGLGGGNSGADDNYGASCAGFAGVGGIAAFAPGTGGAVRDSYPDALRYYRGGGGMGVWHGGSGLVAGAVVSSGDDGGFGVWVAGNIRQFCFGFDNPV